MTFFFKTGSHIAQASLKVSIPEDTSNAWSSCLCLLTIVTIDMCRAWFIVFWGSNSGVDI